MIDRVDKFSRFCPRVLGFSDDEVEQTYEKWIYLGNVQARHQDPDMFQSRINCLAHATLQPRDSKAL